MPREDDTKVCDLDTLKCYYDAAINSTKESEGCNCLQPCINIEYTLEVERETFEHRNKTGITILSLIFEKHLTELHTSYVAYTIQNFVADCGGLCGLFFGFSLLSIYELICNFIVLCLDKFRNRSNRRVIWIID
ncbi:hypothetical protein PVAND_005808 [Polypedilum vanderplanki]|uniref:Uncharacterized protein n=1 Tax=Polypedilum vanderplanki TaxID=319348 RepID=A0A9J6C1M7_POLVA|nr:hypothetical protein PVAND_005808 [Polypedilum vanderplanki]